MDTQNPFTDPAAPILAGDPALDDQARSDLWEVFHSSKDPAELAQHLQVLAVPEDTKKRLYDAKKTSMAATEPLGKTTEAISHLASIPQETLDLAESHPQVLKALVSAVGGPQEASGETAGAGKGKGADGDKKPAPLVQPPRPDGLPHLPPIPEGHHRVLASDGGIHDIPAENIEKARALDPKLHVLNP